jgi:hypothetical protein
VIDSLAQRLGSGETAAQLEQLKQIAASFK